MLGHVQARRRASQGGAVDEGLAVEAGNECSSDMLPIRFTDRQLQTVQGVVVPNVDWLAWWNSPGAECFLLGCRQDRSDVLHGNAVVAPFAVVLAQNGDDLPVKQLRHENSAWCSAGPSDQKPRASDPAGSDPTDPVSINGSSPTLYLANNFGVRVIAQGAVPWQTKLAAISEPASVKICPPSRRLSKSVGFQKAAVAQQANASRADLGDAKHLNLFTDVSDKEQL